MVEEEFDFNKSVKNLAAIDYNIDKVIEKYDPKKRVSIESNIQTEGISMFWPMRLFGVWWH